VKIEKPAKQGERNTEIDSKSTRITWYLLYNGFASHSYMQDESHSENES